ncbi:C2 domain-containing protein 5, partial [Bulinus truncatus]
MSPRKKKTAESDMSPDDSRHCGLKHSKFPGNNGNREKALGRPHFNTERNRLIAAFSPGPGAGGINAVNEQSLIYGNVRVFDVSCRYTGKAMSFNVLSTAMFGMPGRVKVRILGARDLPVMDRASELTDAFVEIRFGEETFKTDVCKKSLNPQWNSEWFKFEVDDEVLQDDPLDLKVLDYDTYSAHDTIGKVYIDLNPLLSRENSNIISGWFPIYDTMHGLRGELNIQVRVELFSDFNKFRQSSCGIQFFCSCEVPTGWRIQGILGFVEELVVNDDPEYQWIEKIRTPRASNEARQRLFSKLSGTLQRKLGVKVMEMGGNAVLGYFQNFDLEGEFGVVVRGIGTAVSLIKLHVGQLSPAVPLSSSVSPIKDMRRHTVSLHHQNTVYSQNKSDRHAYSPLSRQLSSPGPSPSTSPSTISPKSGPFSHRSSSCYSRSPPPSAPPFIHQSGGPNQSLFTFPYSSSFPEEFTLSSSNTLTPQSQMCDPVSVDIPSPTAASSAPTSPPVSPPVQQQTHRNSTSPVRTGRSPDMNRRLSDSEISSPPKVTSLVGNSAKIMQLNSNALPNPLFSKASIVQQSIDLLNLKARDVRNTISFDSGVIEVFFPASFENVGASGSTKSMLVTKVATRNNNTGTVEMDLSIKLKAQQENDDDDISLVNRPEPSISGPPSHTRNSSIKYNVTELRKRKVAPSDEKQSSCYPNNELNTDLCTNLNLIYKNGGKRTKKYSIIEHINDFNSNRCADTVCFKLDKAFSGPENLLEVTSSSMHGYFGSVTQFHDKNTKVIMKQKK